MFPSHIFPIDNPVLSYLGVEFVAMGEGAAASHEPLAGYPMAAPR